MARRSFKAGSADGPMLFPALEMHYPEAQRITNDPDAIDMLAPGLRVAARLMRSRRLLDWTARALDRQTPGAWGGMVARKRYADDQVVAALETGIDQVVILGAGFDTRSFRLAAPAGARAYEVDLPGNIARKERVLRRRFGRIPEGVTPVAVDFEADDLAAALAGKGFDGGRRTMFVLEAVTQYLTEAAADRLFSFLGSAPGSSRLVFTYVRQDFLDGRETYGWDSAYRKWVVRDRVWTFGLEPERVADFLRTYAWTEREQLGPDEYRARYFRPAGRELTAMPIERAVLAEKDADR